MTNFKLETIFLLMMFSASAVAATDIACSPNLVGGERFDSSVQSLRALYQQEKFVELDFTLDCLMNSEERFLSGKSGAIAVYWFFRKELPAPGDVEGDAGRIGNWKKSSPESDYAKFASLRLVYADAWNARGAYATSQTKEDQFRSFFAKLRETESGILSLESQLLETPISQNLLLAVALDLSSPQTDPMEVFISGVQKWPDYYDFYEVLLTRLVPKWDGSWEVVDEFIRHWSGERASSEGDSLYARLYYFLHSRGNVIRDTLVDWPTLESSLRTLVEKYPTIKHRNISAFYACVYGDMDFYLEHTSSSALSTDQGSTGSPHIESGWLFGASQEACDEHYSIAR